MAERSVLVPQLVGAAVGVVLGAALLFAVVGNLRDDGPVEPAVVAEPDGAGDEAPADDPTADEPAAPDGDEPAQDDPGTDPDATEPTEEPAPTDEPEPTSTPAPPAEEVDPATISIQVLDAIASDEDSSAAEAVAAELRDQGFNVIVVNQAGRDYQVTTVFWSPGQENEGRTVAAAISAGEAEQTPEEVQLSDSVDVHVVVGADRA